MNFQVAIERVLGHEDGYVNNPNDPGGETKWGISKRSYPHLLIRDLTREQAIEIYRRDFWLRMGADALPGAVAYQLLDFAVNSGIETAIRYFQRVLGVADDGHFGPVSRQAMARMSTADMILGLNALRLDYMTRLRGWDEFGRGWARRIATNLRYGADDV